MSKDETQSLLDCVLDKTLKTPNVNHDWPSVCPLRVYLADSVTNLGPMVALTSGT